MREHSQRQGSRWIVAHRGAMTEAPENTRAAFDAALAYPVDGIELDVQMTQDDVLVLHHDGDLRRTHGDKRSVAEQRFAELDGLDWGGWFSEAFRGERLLTLDETLNRYAAKTRLLVEIKSSEGDRRSGRALVITRRVLETLEQRVPASRVDDIFLLSFDRDVLREARGSQWKLVLNSDDPSSLVDSDTPGDAHIFAYSAPVARIEPSMTRRWHEAGKRVMTYSCNTPREVDQAIAASCDVIMTDKPGWIFDYLRSQGVDR